MKVFQEAGHDTGIAVEVPGVCLGPRDEGLVWGPLGAPVGKNMSGARF